MNRTGISTQYRLCPRHGTALEVSIEENDASAACLNWWCDACGGAWSENYFAMRAESVLPLLALERNFRIGCPRCGSLRAARDCEFVCCDFHRCSDCGLLFDIAFTITAPSNLAPRRLARLKARNWLDDSGIISEQETEEFEHFAIELRLLRFCDRHLDVAPVLVANRSATDERYRFGWSCSSCRTVTYDYMRHYPRVYRSFFRLGAHPDFRCRVCHHAAFDQSEGLLKPRCLTCGTVFELSLVPTPE